MMICCGSQSGWAQAHGYKEDKNEQVLKVRILGHHGACVYPVLWRHYRPRKHCGNASVYIHGACILRSLGTVFADVTNTSLLIERRTIVCHLQAIYS